MSGALYLGGIMTGYPHKSEPEPRNGNVNTVYFIHQVGGNTRISHTESVYNEQTCGCKCLLALSFQLRIMFAKNEKIYFCKSAFYAMTLM